MTRSEAFGVCISLIIGATCVSIGLYALILGW